MTDFEETDAFKEVKSKFEKIKPYIAEIFPQYVVLGTIKVDDENPSVPVMFMTGNLYDCYSACHRTLVVLSSINPPSQLIPEPLDTMIRRCYPKLLSICKGLIIIGIADSATSVYIIPSPKTSNRFNICSSLLWILQKILAGIGPNSK